MNGIKMLVLCLTGRCNLACRYCYALDYDKNKMRKETAIKAVNLAAEGGEPFVLQFSGGEPLLNYSVLKTVVEYVHINKIPAKMQLKTNGTKLTDEMAVFLGKNKVEVVIGLDGRPKVNDKLRLKKNGYGATGDILKGLEVLKHNNITCSINCVITGENVNELEELVDFAYFIGNIRHICFDLLRGGRENSIVSPTESEMDSAIKRVFERLEVLESMAGYEISISHQETFTQRCSLQDRSFGHCYAMNGYAACVDAKGDIYACPSLLGIREYYIGNVQTGIETVLAEQIRHSICENMALCWNCADFKHCGGGCYARWLGTEANQYPAECVLIRGINNYQEKKKNRKF